MKELQMCIPSNRIYLDELDFKDQEHIYDHFEIYGLVGDRLYNKKYKAKYMDKTDFDYVKQSSIIYEDLTGKKLSAYYQTNFYSFVNGMISSQDKCFKLYKEQVQQNILNIEEKIKSFESELSKKLEVKQGFINYYKGLDYQEIFNKHKLVIKENTVTSGIGKFKTETNLYLYELKLNKRIKFLKSQINILSNKIKVIKEKELNIPKRITFGGKKFYKSKDTTNILKLDWHKRRKRHNRCLLSGRHTSIDGNFIARYKYLEDKIYIALIDRYEVVFDIYFPYKGDMLINAIKDKQSVGYFLNLKTDRDGRDYIIVEAAFKTQHRVNDYVKEGVISIDTNKDFLAVTELNSDGVKISQCNLNIKDLNDKQLQIVINKLTDMAHVSKKPIVCEDLSFKNKKKNLKYKDKKYNNMISTFAYSKVINLLERSAFKKNVDVIKVNPKYTSLIGKIKYIKLYHISIHTAASIVIGRKAMGFNEKIPKYIKYNTWDKVYKNYKNISSNEFKINIA